MVPSLLRLYLLVSVLLGSTPLLAQNYTASELPAPEWPDEWVTGDMNGNGRLDLILPVWSPERGRQLDIHLQQADGRFAAQASRTVDIRPDIIAVSLADVRPLPGQELILISHSAVYSLSSMLPGYDNNLERLFDWAFIASVPDRQRTLFLPPAQDITGNGRLDLLLPGRERYGLFTLRDDGRFDALHQFSTENEDLEPEDLPLNTGRFDTEITLNARDGLSVRIVPRSNSLFEDFLQDRRGQQQNRGNLLEFRHRMAGAVSAPLRSGAGRDILFTNVGDDLRARINTLSVREAGDQARIEHWHAPANDSGDYRLLDVTGNGRMDLIRIEDDEDDWDVHFYRNREGRFDFDQPDQIMRFSGYDLRVNALDISGNGQPELAVTYYTIPATAALRNAGIDRVQLIYGAADGDQGLFNTRPDSRHEERFSADAVRGLSEPIHLAADLDGDGRKDALYLTADGILAASRLDDSLTINSDPFWQYVPNRTITGFDVLDLNANGRPDLLLHHSNATTVLMSAP